VRLVSKAAGPRLKVKTIEAIVEHVTQTLPESDGGYYKPLTQDYLKALSSLFEHQHIVEFLKPEIWLEVVDFCIQAINQYMDITDGEPSGLSRRFLGLGTNSRSTSILRSTDSVPKNPLSRPNIEDLFQTLLSLVSSTNALLTDRYSSIADSAMRFLQSQGSSVSQVHHLAFSIINAILRFTRIDHYSFSQSIACRSIPVICRIWRGKSLTRDSMLNSVRDEILGLLLTVHLHLERCVRDDKDSDTLSNLEELLDSLRGDYAKRNGEEMLLLDYICMADFSSESCGRGPFRLYPFHLALHNTRGERDWATLQTIGVLERLVNIGYTLRVSVANEVEQIEKHPRKRQRISHNSDRILDPLKNDNEQVRTSGLQLIPFVLEDCQLPINELRVLLDQLIKCTTDKRSNIASWALLALAR
jgi:ataxia telangiectasia mutated family protein